MNGNNQPFIKSRLLRVSGAFLFFASFVFVFVHLMMAHYAGTTVATAEAASVTSHPVEEEFSKMFRHYQYYKFAFAPVALSPDMGNLKLVLKVDSQKLSPNRKAVGISNWKKMKLPHFVIRDELSEKIIWEQKSTRTITTTPVGSTDSGFTMTTTSSDYGFVHEGRENRIASYALGYLTAPHNSRYILIADNIILREGFVLSPQDQAERFYFEVVSGGVDIDHRKIMYAAAGIIAGAFLLFLTAPRQKIRVRRR